MTTVETEPVYDRAAKVFQDEGLVLPEVSPSLKPELRQVSETAFATRDLPWSLYDIPLALAELTSGQPVAPYLAFGLAGHGIASQAVHAHEVTDQTAVYLQVRWGTIFDDPEADRKRFAASLRLRQRLAGLVKDAVQSGRFPADRRLVVVQSSFLGSQWCWLPTAGSLTTPPEWNRSPDLALGLAIAELNRMLTPN